METKTAHTVEPAAWRCRLVGEGGKSGWILCYFDHSHEEGSECEPLYSQEAITQLTTERDAAVKDAERYRAMRNLPYEMLGVAGVPCVALPESELSGDYLNGDDCDIAVDAAIANTGSGK